MWRGTLLIDDPLLPMHGDQVLPISRVVRGTRFDRAVRLTSLIAEAGFVGNFWARGFLIQGGIFDAHMLLKPEY